MYFYIPIIVTPYDEFVKTFGKSIDFGAYCEENSPVLIEKNIRGILTDSSYGKLCINSHNAVKDYTWSAYIDKVIKQIERETGLLVYNMPKKEEYFLELKFEV